MTTTTDQYFKQKLKKPGFAQLVESIYEGASQQFLHLSINYENLNTDFIMRFHNGLGYIGACLALPDSTNNSAY